MDAARDLQLRRRYGISIERYRQMMTNQDGRCNACGLEWEGWEQRFSVDHDHATGNVRALLCQPCNLALGHVQDDPERLQLLIDYLRRHSFGY
ncbi:endonuclease VII domain-containing protein [Agrococcus jejuensis]|nr:endonuclease VII domain-containing protein [Agrococcus jejuensis]